MNNIKTFGILLALPALASIANTVRHKPQPGDNKLAQINFFSSTQPAYAIVGIIGAGLIIFTFLAIVALLIQAMLTSLEVEASKHKQPTLKHLWEMAKKYWLRLFGLALAIGMYIVLSSLIGVLVLAVGNGSVLGLILGIGLIAAAVLFVLTHYYLAPYAMIDEDLGVFAAMERSANLSKPYVGYVLSVIGVAIALSFTAIVPVIGPVLSFVLSSLYIVAPALRYQELKKLVK